MQQLINLDKALFKIINGQLTNPFFDWIMPWLRNSDMWIPLYLFLVLFILINFKKQGFWIIAFAIITITITDGISSKILKPYFDRLRPCNDPDMATMIRFLLPYRPGNGSFTSSHATNHFGIAMFLYMALKKYFSRSVQSWMLLLFVWAFFISYAQVYVGVHYPGDVIAGGILGCLLGYGTAYILNRFMTEKNNLST